MKCRNCGAEATGRFCSYCGSEMPQQPVNIVNNFYGESNIDQGPQRETVYCTQCGHNGVTFKRESNGMGGYKTVGLCNYCGNTWVTAQDQNRFLNFDNVNLSFDSSPRDPYMSDKSKVIALILCLFFGAWGLHYFYVGRIGMGILYIFTIGFWGIGIIVDIIRILVGSFRDSQFLSTRRVPQLKSP